MRLPRWLWGLHVGRYYLRTADRDEGGGPNRLWLIRDDFRTVLVCVPWPRWWWPFRSGLVRPLVERAVFWLLPGLKRERDELYERIEREHGARL